MTPKTECACCGQDWAVTFAPRIGKVCVSCSNELRSAEAILATIPGICSYPEYDCIWWKQMLKHGEVIVHQ